MLDSEGMLRAADNHQDCRNLFCRIACPLSKGSLQGPPPWLKVIPIIHSHTYVMCGHSRYCQLVSNCLVTGR